MKPGRLRRSLSQYQLPEHIEGQARAFTDVAPEGPQGLFSDVELGRLREVLDGVRNSAVAAGE